MKGLRMKRSVCRRANGYTYSCIPHWDCNAYEPWPEDFDFVQGSTFRVRGRMSSKRIGPSGDLRLGFFMSHEKNMVLPCQRFMPFQLGFEVELNDRFYALDALLKIEH